MIFNFMLGEFARKGDSYSYDEINEIVKRETKMKSYVDLDYPPLALAEHNVCDVMRELLIQKKSAGSGDGRRMDALLLQ